MNEILIKPSNHTGTSNDDFVGMQFVSNDGVPSVNAIFPHGYHFTSIDNPKIQHTLAAQTLLRRELYALLSSIKRFSRNADGKLDGVGEMAEFPFNAYITIIKAFMQYGYYIESEIKYKHAPLGRINWKRTIAEVRPLLQDGSPIYTDFVIRQNEKKKDKLISLIHYWCVYDAFNKLGWLFTSFKPHKPALKIDEGNKDYFISVIRDSLKTTFNDRNKMLFSAMIAMLSQKRGISSNSFFFGTTHFRTVWENLIDLSFGSVFGADKKKYFPPARWFFENGEKDKQNSLMPDTIMLSKNDAFILDAKYYGYIRDRGAVPAAADINKQITYGKYAYDEFVIGKRDTRHENVYNAFLIPYDFEENRYNLPLENMQSDDKSQQICYGYIGFAALVDGEKESNPKGDGTHEQVLGILIDTKWLMHNAGKINNEQLAEFIREKRKSISEKRKA